MEETQKKFNAIETLAQVREAREKRRRRCTWGKSRLTPHRAELVKLHMAGGSLADLTFWLKKEKRIKVAASTVHRYLKKQPELAAGA